VTDNNNKFCEISSNNILLHYHNIKQFALFL